MPLIARKFTRSEKAQVMKISREVRARRKKLGLRQKDLDVFIGLRPRTIERIERLRFNRRCLAPDDPVIPTVLEALEKIEKDPSILHRATLVNRPRSPVLDMRSRRPRPNVSATRDPITLHAKLIRCPDQDCWMTQSGCESLRGVDRTCRSLNGGRGCRGVKHRRNLERKRVEVNYTPPTENEAQQPNRYHSGGNS